MPAPLIDAITIVPSRTSRPEIFSTEADAFAASLLPFQSQANAQAAHLNDLTEQAFAAGLEGAAANAAMAQSAANQTALDRIATNGDATSANASKEQAAISAASASASASATLTAAQIAGARAYATLALANADFANLVNNQVVFIANVGEYHYANGTPVTSLVFLRAQEYYTSPSAAIASDSIQNTITKLLVATGIVPAAAPSLTLGA